MNTTELVALFRTETNDTERPYIWQDALLYAYVDDAQKQFCRETYGIEDARSFTITLAAAVEWYAISPKITEILGAYDSAGRSMPVMTRNDNLARNVRFDGRTGFPDALFKGMEKGFLRAYPIPIASGSIRLETRRLPEDVADGDDLEIDEHHHLALLSWVKHKAYDNQEEETKDSALSERFKAEFMDYCAKSYTEQGRLNRKVAIVKFRSM